VIIIIYSGFRSEKPTKARDTVHELKVNLEKLYNGCTKHLKINRFCYTILNLFKINFLDILSVQNVKVWVVQREQLVNAKLVEAEELKFLTSKSDLE